MDAALMEAPPVGHNQPPEATPFEIVKNGIDDIYAEAKHWLDGGTVSSQAEADNIGLLLDMARKSWTAADDQRKAEKRPHDDAAKAVQEKYKPLLTRAELVETACKHALAPWLWKIEAANRAQAEEAKRIAQEEAATAEQAIRQAQGGSISDLERAEEILRSAKRAAKIAKKTGKARAQASGGDRAVTLRTSYVAELTNETDFARFAWAHHRDELHQFLLGIAQRLVNAGRYDLPGVTVHEQKTAV